MFRHLGRMLLVALALTIVTHAAEARRHRAPIAVTVEQPTVLQKLFGGSTLLIDSARRHLGATASQLGLPRSLWCADFMNQTLRRSGYQGTGSRTARSFLANPRASPRVGTIVVLTRKGGGHVGIVSGFNGKNPIVVSGNSTGRRVTENEYPASRVLAYVLPR